MNHPVARFEGELAGSGPPPDARTRRAGPGVSFALVVSAGAFCAAALACAPELGPLRVYTLGVAALLLVCAAAAWRARRLPPASGGLRVARYVGLVQWGLTALVWSLPLFLYGYAAVAALRVGHWPSYGQPDPKDLELPVLHQAVAAAFYASALAVPAWAVWFPLSAGVRSWRSVRWHTVLFAGGVGVLFVSLVVDPLGAWGWYAD